MNEKARLIIAALCIGSILAFCFELSVFSRGDERGVTAVDRNSYGEGNKELSFKVYKGNGAEPEKITVSVSEREYTDEEIKALADKAKERLFTEILAGNESLDCVTDDLVLMTKLDGLPFTIRWRADEPLLIDKSGRINREKLKEKDNCDDGIITGLTAIMSYRDYKEEIGFFVRIYPKSLTPGEFFSERLKEVLSEDDDKTITEPVFYLPDMIENVPVRFEEIKKSDSPFIMILALIAGIALVFAKEKDKNKKAEDEIKEMNAEYPRIMNKFALYYNAGIPIKSIWNRICMQYEAQVSKGGGRKRIYEEMLISSRQMNEGKGEVSAYEDFALRCNLPGYRKFVSLIEQALIKGKNDMGFLLQKEAQDAFEERKARARIEGEKAGTKLLIPMFMMLIIVLLMIMIPAFFSFRM